MKTSRPGSGTRSRRSGRGTKAGAAGQFARSLAWFRNMVDNSLAHVRAERRRGRHVVGIACEYTPRELIMAAGGIPVCLCGGFAEMIPPAEETLPANLCPLIKSTFGFSVTRENPFLEMAELVVAETTCDGKKKMYEIMAQSRPMHVLELPQKPDDSDAMEHWVSELKKLKSALENRFRARITDGNLRAAIRAMNRERALRRSIAEFMKSDAPPITGRELLDMKSLVCCMPRDFAQYESALRALPALRRSSAGAPPVRVLLTGVPVPHGAEKVVDIIEDNGGLIVCQENCTGLKPLLEDVDARAADPLRAIAEKYFHLPCSVMTPNHRRLESLTRLAAEYRPQCVVELIWQACLTYDVESAAVKQLVAGELGLPYLRIKTDYSPSDSARIAMRVQALFETVRSRRAGTAAGGRRSS